jgi:hypothetical protein
MRVWRWSLWLLPLATLIPLGYFVYELATLDYSAYFAGVSAALLIVLVGVPNVVILGMSVVAALVAWRNRPLTSLVIVAAICAWQLSPIVWSPEFWRVHERAAHLLLFAVPGVVAGLVGLTGLLLLRDRKALVAGVVAGLLLLPIASSAAGLVAYRVEVARECPAGPAIDLTFSGLETAHFTTSCGKPSDITTLAGCTSYAAALEMFDWQSWDLSFQYSDAPVTADKFSFWAPYLIVGANTSYGGPYGWSGMYRFDEGKRCEGSVDADLFAGAGANGGRHVHVSGRFAAP